MSRVHEAEMRNKLDDLAAKINPVRSIHPMYRESPSRHNQPFTVFQNNIIWINPTELTFYY